MKTKRFDYSFELTDDELIRHSDAFVKTVNDIVAALQRLEKVVGRSITPNENSEAGQENDRDQFVAELSGL